MDTRSLIGRSFERLQRSMVTKLRHKWQNFEKNRSVLGRFLVPCTRSASREKKDLGLPWTQWSKTTSLCRTTGSNSSIATGVRWWGRHGQQKTSMAMDGTRCGERFHALKTGRTNQHDDSMVRSTPVSSVHGWWGLQSAGVWNLDLLRNR